ncbi:hypothetical protein JCM10212_005758 [Sporobolomyces blumeae]
MSTPSPSSPPDSLVLYALSSSLALSLAVPLSFVLARLITKRVASSHVDPPVPRRRTRLDHRVSLGLGLSSTCALVLHGVCGLVALAQASDDASIVGAIFGALAVLTIDLQSIVRLVSAGSSDVAGLRRLLGWTLSLSFLLLLTTILHVVLLSIPDPPAASAKSRLGLTHARGVFHLLFDGIVIFLLAKRAKEGSQAQPTDSEDKKLEIRLLLLQLFSALLSILSISLPILPNYVALGSSLAFDPLHVVPTVFGSTTSGGGAVALAVFTMMRWYGNLRIEETSRDGQAQLDARDTESNVAPGSEFPFKPRDSSLDPVSTASRASEPSSSLPLGRDCDLEAQLEPSRPVPVADSVSSTPSRTQSPLDALDRPTTSRSRHHSLSSSLSYAANVPPAISEEGSNERSREGESSGSTDLHEAYLHTETVPVPSGTSSDDGHDVGDGATTAPSQFDGFRRSPPVASRPRPRSASSPEPLRVVPPRTPSPSTSRRRIRKDALTLSKSEVDLATLRLDFKAAASRDGQVACSPSISAASSTTDLSPVSSRSRTRPVLEIDVDARDDSFHTATSTSPVRSCYRRRAFSSNQPDESRPMTPPSSPSRTRASTPSLLTTSPTRARQAPARSLAGPHPGDSPTSVRSGRRWSRASSISFLRGAAGLDKAQRGTDDNTREFALDLETDEDDPFAPTSSRQALEAAKKVQEWKDRKERRVDADLVDESEDGRDGESSEGEGGRYEEEIEIVSPTRYHFERLDRENAPVKLSSSALFHLGDPTLHPRRSSSSQSLFREHLDDGTGQDLDLPAHLRRQHSISPTTSRRRDGKGSEGKGSRDGTVLQLSTSDSLGSSAFSYNETIGGPGHSTPRTLLAASTSSKLAKSSNMHSSSSSSSPSAAARLLEVMGVRTSPTSAFPPRADSPTRRPASTALNSPSSPERSRPRRSSRSSAPAPSSPAHSPSSSPKLSPIRRLFLPSRSETLPSPPLTRRLASSPVLNTSSLPALDPTRAPKSSRASSTFSTSSFRLLPSLKRRSTTGMLRGSLSLKGFGLSVPASNASTARQSASSDLSFMCRGDVSSSKDSSERRSRGRSVSLDLDRFASSKGDEVYSEAKTGEEVLRSAPTATPPSSPTLTTSWWARPPATLRSTTPFRPSVRRGKYRLSKSASAPDLVHAFGESRGPSFESEGDTIDSCEAPIRPVPFRGRHTRTQSLPLAGLSAYQLAAPVRVSPIGSLIFSSEEESAPKPGALSNLANSISLGQPIALGSITCDERPPGAGHERTISGVDVDELTALYETFTPYDLSEAPSRASLDLTGIVVNETALDDDPPTLTIRDTFLSSLPLASVGPLGSSFVDRPLTPVPSTASFSPSTNASASASAASQYPDRAFTPSSPTSTFLTTNTTPASVPPSPVRSVETAPSSYPSSSSLRTDGTKALFPASVTKGSQARMDATSINFWLHKRSSWLEEAGGEQEYLEATGESEQML